MEMRQIEVDGEYIELNKLLKFEGLVMSGGEAKQLILSEAVSVDGQIETRIRRKLSKGSRVVVAGQVTLELV